MSETGIQQLEPDLKLLSDRLAALRSARGWTLEELAERSGLSRPFLSRLEAGTRQPSIAVILTLARVFGVSIGDLFDQPPVDQSCVVIRAAEVKTQISNGLSYAPLSIAARFANLQPLRVCVFPDRAGDERFQHEGEEWVYVLSGKLSLLVGEKQYTLDVGDAAHFDSRQPHRLVAMDGNIVEAIVVACPLPESSAPPPMRHMKQHRAVR